MKCSCRLYSRRKWPIQKPILIDCLLADVWLGLCQWKLIEALKWEKCNGLMREVIRGRGCFLLERLQSLWAKWKAESKYRNLKKKWRKYPIERRKPTTIPWKRRKKERKQIKRRSEEMKKYCRLKENCIRKKKMSAEEEEKRRRRENDLAITFSWRKRNIYSFGNRREWRRKAITKKNEKAENTEEERSVRERHFVEREHGLYILSLSDEAYLELIPLPDTISCSTWKCWNRLSFHLSASGENSTCWQGNLTFLSLLVWLCIVVLL